MLLTYIFIMQKNKNCHNINYNRSANLMRLSLRRLRSHESGSDYTATFCFRLIPPSGPV